MSPKYLSDIIPSTARRYALRNANNIPLVINNTSDIANTFFSSKSIEWNQLHPEI